MIDPALRWPFPERPSRIVATPDGVPIAVFEAALAGDDDQLGVAARNAAPTLVFVHGTTADHTTFRAVAPVLARRRRVVAIDRRGRGASGDAVAFAGSTPAGYSIELEYDDLAAVAQSLATLDGRPVDVLGHSYGGRVGLGAALSSPAIRRLVVYEGAPSAAGLPYRPPGVEDRVRQDLAGGDNDAALATFFREIVGMSEADLAAYRANPIWPIRAAAAGTTLRELEAEASPSASLEALASVAIPVLLVLGSASRPPFAAATDALAARLPDARVAVIEGAAHAAHHTHVPEFVAAVEAFLDR
jgi:pimeloyl-ACP methyl ester carboxylesterase